MADRELLVRVISNFVDNCIKYGPSGGRIWLDAALNDDGEIVIEVRGEGPGVPVDLRDEIFEKYSKVERDQRRLQPTVVVWASGSASSP